MIHRGNKAPGVHAKRTRSLIIAIIMDDFVMSESSVVVLSTIVANNRRRKNARESTLNGLSSNVMSMQVMGNISLVGGACVFSLRNEENDD